MTRTKRGMTIPPERRRTRQIVVRVNAAEHAELTRRLVVSGRRRLATYIRCAALGTGHAESTRAGLRAPHARLYGELARTAANLNQIAHHLNEGHILGATGTEELARVVDDLYREVRALRRALVGADDVSDTGSEA